MAVKTYKPKTAGLRGRKVLKADEITGNSKKSKLLVSRKQRAGRNNEGKLTVRHRGGGAKRKYRVIDYKRDKDNIPAKVEAIEYDPNRGALVALLSYKDGEKRYIIHPQGLKAGGVVISGTDVDIEVGNTLPLENIPAGAIIHCVELSPGKGAQLARTAGGYVTLMAKGSRYVTIKLPSGEVRYILGKCKATIGAVGNSDLRNTRKGKAGVNRWKGKRPTVRGAVMNPCDHPHGGGEGRAPVGRSGPMTPWGKKALGLKTRNSKKASSRMIVRRGK